MVTNDSSGVWVVISASIFTFLSLALLLCYKLNCSTDRPDRLLSTDHSAQPNSLNPTQPGLSQGPPSGNGEQNNRATSSCCVRFITLIRESWPSITSFNFSRLSSWAVSWSFSSLVDAGNPPSALLWSGSENTENSAGHSPQGSSSNDALDNIKADAGAPSPV